MNVLAMVKRRLEKAARLKGAQQYSLVYRGVPYDHGQRSPLY